MSNESPHQEGITPELHAAVEQTVNSLERMNIAVKCVLAFGSRAQNLARQESDLDLFYLLDFSQATAVDDVALIKAKDDGQAVTEMNGPAGDLHMYIYNWRGFTERIREMEINSSPLFTGFVKGSVLQYGEEPKIDGVPLLEYLKARIDE